MKSKRSVPALSAALLLALAGCDKAPFVADIANVPEAPSFQQPSTSSVIPSSSVPGDGLEVRRVDNRTACLQLAACSSSVPGDNLKILSEHNRNFRAHLSGREEVPPVPTQAQGQAIFQLSKDGSELSYKLIVANIENVTQAHIHLAPRGDEGPVVAWLYPSGPPPRPIPGTFNGVLAEGVITEDDLVGPLEGGDFNDLILEIRQGNAYVNVQTSQFPAGEIRGQIH